MKKYKLSDVLILIAGVGFKKSQRVFSNNDTSDIIQINGVKYKINIGTAIAKLLTKKGAKICMIARNEQSLSQIKYFLCKEKSSFSERISYQNVDLLDDISVKKFISTLDKDQPIWLIHSIGLGAQAYTINGDNPYLPFTDISPDLVVREFEAPVKSLLLLIQHLEPFFKKQRETRIIVITSMSGIRPYVFGYSHASAKAGIHHAVRTLTLELSQKYKNVYVTEILPGIVDTGLYDSEKVIKSVQQIGETFGYWGDNKYDINNFPLMPPSAVAESVVLALQSEAHILSINMVAHGQFTNVGA